jgi:hypothetical protein
VRLIGVVSLSISLLSAPVYAALIGSDLSGNLYDVNATTDAATNVRPTGISNLIGIAFGPGGVLYGLATTAAGQNVSLYTINPTSGASSLVGTSAPAAFNDAYGEGDIGYNAASGTLYGIEYSHFTGGSPPVIEQLFTINPQMAQRRISSICPSSTTVAWWITAR